MDVERKKEPRDITEAVQRNPHLCNVLAGWLCCARLRCRAGQCVFGMGAHARLSAGAWDL